MLRELALTERKLAADPDAAAAILTREVDLTGEGWSVEHVLVDAGETVQQVAAEIALHAPDHLQIFGHVPVPQVIEGPDGHGFRAGDCDAPYATGSLDGWRWNGTAFGLASWPTDAARSISRIDTSNLGVIDELTGFLRAMQRNHAYRSGTFEYDGLACLVDRLDYLDAGLTARLITHMQAIVGAWNVLDATRAYPDETFFQTYKGRSFLVGSLFSGGDPFPQSNSVPGHEYYVGATADFASGLVSIGLLRLFCSYGWQFETWPLSRAALVGGSLAVLYDPWGQADLSGWSSTRSIGQTVRLDCHRAGMPTIFTLQGDGTLCRRDQDMGVALATYTADMAKVNARLDKIESGTTTGGTVSTSAPFKLISARYEVRDHTDVASDVTHTTAMVQAMIDGGGPIFCDDRYGDPWGGQWKQLRLTYSKANIGVVVKIVAQNTNIALGDL